MLTELTPLFKKPPLYTKTEIPFWDDEHISLQMLNAHLNPNYDGASRKLEFIEKSVDWISKILPSEHYPSVLDIGCGPGLYTERYAKKGYRVVGVDFSHRSINYAQMSAKRKGLPIDYFYQDYLKLSLDKKFDFATMIYCDFGALSTNDRKQLLKIISLDWEHETELKENLKVYFQEQKTVHEAAKKESAKKHFEFRQREADTKEMVTTKKCPNGVPLSEDELKEEKERLAFYKTTARDYLLRYKQHEKEEKQFSEYLKLL